MILRLFDADWPAKERATLCFVRKQGRILLIKKKRGLGAGKVNGPGGRIESNETAEECAVREVQEEIGVTPTGLSQKAELRFEFADGYRLACAVFLADGHVGEPVSTDEAEPFWVDESAIPYDRMWEDDRHWLPLVLAGQTVRAAFLFDGERMLEKAILTLRDDGVWSQQN
jgi:8-oxo-dGTP diphosphatase